jgi:hypothetical protein
MTIADPGAGHTWAQVPHPVHLSSMMRGLPARTSMAPGTGQRSEHTEQNDPMYARHMGGWMAARAMVSGWSERRTPGAQALMQGVSAHMTQAAVLGSIMGVPAASRNLAGASTIA